MLRPMFVMAVVGVLAASVSAQTVTFDVRATSATTVAPGGTVDYEITASVDNVNNQGLILFVVSMLTDLGEAQDPVTGFGTVVNDHFNFLAKQSGTPMDDDLEEVGAAQGLTAPFETGIGQGTPVVLAFGTLQAPNVEGTYNVDTDPGTATANLANSDNSGAMAASSIVAGAGFQVVVQTPEPDPDPDPDPDPNDGGGGDNTGGDNTGGDNTGGDGDTNTGGDNNDGGNSGPCGVGVPGAAGASFLMLSFMRFTRRRRYFE